MKQTNTHIVIIFVIAMVTLCSCMIENPKPEECTIQTEKIIAIKEGTSFDIVFSDAHGDHYYINRGLERGLILDLSLIHI